MNLELPKKLQNLYDMSLVLAAGMLRPISRKYDRAEHVEPKEMYTVAAMIEGMNAGDGDGGGVASATLSTRSKEHHDEIQNSNNMASVVGTQGLCWGDVGLVLGIPRQGLGNSAIASVANEQQLKRFANKWAAMAITEPEAGSDSAAIKTTAKLDGDEYVLNGEKIFITSGSRADLIVVWATLDPSLGRAAIKSFVVEHGTSGMEIVRLEKKLGIKASDTVTIILDNCRVPKENLLGSPEIDVKKGFAGVMQTFDNTRPLVASMAVGLAKAALDKTKALLARQLELDYTKATHQLSYLQQRFYYLEAEWEAARLLTLRAAWMADNGQPNSMEASMAKAKAGRMCNQLTLECVSICGALGYSEQQLLEKWARDSKILDIFEGTQQIQQLIIARRLLNKSSAQLK